MKRSERNELMVKKIIDALQQNEYMKAEDLSKRCKMSKTTMYRFIKKIRLMGTGILPTSKGYILSEYAKPSDDTGFIRRCLGRRTADIIAINAAEKDILKRWRKITHGKNNITPILEHLSANAAIKDRATNSMKFMLSYVNNKGS